MKKYEVIEHTADIGIEVFGKTMRDIFIHSAEGMFAIITGNRCIEKSEDFLSNVILKGEEFEDLLVRWLNELLYISETKLIILTQFTIEELSNHQIKAVVKGKKINETGFKIEKEIKAVTYHDLEIKKDRKKELWTARIIFDI